MKEKGLYLERKALKNLVHFLLRVLTRTEFTGTENIPPTGPLIIATNHLSRLDIPILFDNPVRPDITALVTTKYKAYPFLKWFIISAEGIWLDRDTADFAAFRTAIEALNKGTALGISPEGTRSQTGQLLEGKPGTVLLAMRSQALIVPVGLIGTEKGVHDLLLLRRPKMEARFGPVFRLPPISKDNRGDDIQRATDEIMCRIAVLLPESYRGFYRDHPRVKELLAESVTKSF